MKNRICSIDNTVLPVGWVASTHRKSIFNVIILILITLMISCSSVEKPAKDIAITSAEPEEPFSNSLVYIEISVTPYDTMQPWKRAQSVKIAANGTAVGSDLVITTADAVADASVIQIKRYGQNEFLNAERRVVDYDLNLCLIKITDEMPEPLEPVTFSEAFEQNADLTCRWLSASNQITQGRGFLDRAKMFSCPTSFQKIFCYIVSNASRQTTRGELYCKDIDPIGIAFTSGDNECAIIPAETINRFLAAAQSETYAGFGTQGFETYELLDPTVRKYLKMPEDMKSGVYVSHVYSRGTGRDVLRPGDALLAIDGHELNAYGRFYHEEYDRLSLEYLIQQHPAGDPVTFEVWRDGRRIELSAACERFESADMLVPYQEFDRQPEYLVTGGFVFQKLTRPYMQLWGDNWPGKVPPHLFHYYRDLSLKPTEDRSEIVILSYVLPAPVNQGYQQLGRIVVSKCNGTDIKDMTSFKEALENPADPRFNVIEFEMDNPKVVIPLQNLGPMDNQINTLYGITQPIHIN